MSEFSSLKIVGGLLSSDLLGRVFSGDPQVVGTSPESYGLERGESIRRQASRSWPYLLETWQDEKKRDSRFIRILLRELGFPQKLPEHIAFRAVGWDVSLDHRTPNREARAPHSVMQEVLNRDDTRLWGLLSNGTTVRLLRDSAALISQSYVEFDLRAIFDGELFSDFVLLYLACHESRFAMHGDGGAETCYLEQWRTASADQGERVLGQLREGVKQAISILGTGFIAHPSNPQLRIRLEKNELRLEDLNRALLRVVYRMLFWFVAEDRDALLMPIPNDSPGETQAQLRQARDRYAEYFSADRLRHLARRQRGTRHTDLFDALGLVFDALGAEGGVSQLALPGIGGVFETGALDEPLAGARLTNEVLLSAVRALAWFKSREGGPLRRVDFGNLGAEELGSIYESLLELIPHYDPDQRSYTLTILPGNERKESGSYYTPTSLVECLLDSALDALLDEATAKGTSEEKIAALLDLTVCDPACGSGHFLVAAARRMAKRIAAEETGESEPPETAIRRALRRVVGRCIYGVDINPMSVELAKISLWMEALEPGKPLSYLDQNIRVGNSLLGVTPALLANGLPDEAFTPIEGDDRKVVSALKKQNAAERLGQHDLFSQSGIPVTNAVLAKRADTIVHTLPDSLEDLHVHQQRQAEQLAASAERRIQKLLADAWCAAFVQPKTDVTRSTAITHAVIENMSTDAKSSTIQDTACNSILDTTGDPIFDGSFDLVAAEQRVAALTRQYRFFHWHVEFPHIFRVGNGARDLDPKTGWSGGFSCLIGNPPWERIAFNDDEFFASRAPRVLDTANTAERKKRIDEELASNPTLRSEFNSANRHVDGITHLITSSGRYQLTAVGRLTTQALFVEGSLGLLKSVGRLGMILPTTVLTAVPMKDFWAWLVANRRLRGMLDLENRRKIFPAVHPSTKFALLTLGGRPGDPKRDSLLLGVYIQTEGELKDPGRVYEFPLSVLEELNPITRQLPICARRKDVDLLVAMSRASSPHLAIKPWNGFTSEGHSQYYLNSAAGGAIPLFEGKMIHQFDPSFATYEGTGEDALREGKARRTEVYEKVNGSTPRFYAKAQLVNDFLARKGEQDDWIGVVRRYVRATDERTAIASMVPRTVPIQPLNGFTAGASRAEQIWALACINSFAYDYMVKLKTPGQDFNVTIMSQVPIPSPNAMIEQLVMDSVRELNYTTWQLRQWAATLGDDGPPFRWDEDRRFLLRAELDAAFFHLYGIDRDDVDYIMETFPIVKRKDIAAHGIYRTKDKILEIYDAMAKAKSIGAVYQTSLTPPPGQGPRHPDR